MFFASLKRLALRGFLALLVTNQDRSVCLLIITSEKIKRKSTGGGPKGDPAAVRTATIGVRVSANEFAGPEGRGGSDAYVIRATAAWGRLVPQFAIATRRRHQS